MPVLLGKKGYVMYLASPLQLLHQGTVVSSSFPRDEVAAAD